MSPGRRGGASWVLISVAGEPVPGAVAAEGGRQPIAAQAGDEGLCSPFAERRLGSEPLPVQGPAAPPRHPGGERGRVEKNQTMRLTAPLG